MGVQGLMSYIIDQSSCLKKYKLHNTKVVVDGLNLLHFLYHHFECQWIFSGEYDLFASRLRTFFKKLEECKIEFYVILDGCTNKSLNKEEVLRSRALERLNSCHELNKGKFKKPLLPNLACLTFISVLDECNVFHLTCPEEADNQIAALANHFGCPVLSNDSDFYIFKLSGGFIRLSSLGFAVNDEDCECCSSGHHQFLSCQIFTQSDIRLPGVKKFQPDYMPLLATLVGNDYVRKTDLSTIVNKIDLPKISKRNSSNPKQATKIVGLLVWLHNFTSLEVAVDKVVSYMKEDQRERLRNVVQQSLDQYNTERAWILKHLKMITNSSGDAEYFDWLPAKLRSDFYNGKLKSSILSSIHAGQLYLATYVEDMSQPSIHFASQYLRHVFYSIYRPGLPKEKVIEYIRHGRDFKKYTIHLDSLKDYKVIPIDKSNFLDALKISLDVIPFEEGSQFCSLIVIIKCWLSSAGHSTKTICFEMMSILLTSFYLMIQSNKSKFGISHIQALDFCSKIKKFLDYPVLNRNHPLEVAYIHLYNELQSCYSSFFYLNLYFNCPFITIYPQDIFSGGLFYNLCNEMYSRKCPSIFISNILEQQSSLSSLFYQLYSVFDDSLDARYFTLPK